MNTMIVLVGIPGSGKSSVLMALTEVFPSIKIVNYGDAMLKEVAERGLERDAMRKMPVEKQQDIGLAAARKIAEESQGITIVDTHACVRTPVGYCPGIPLKVLDALQPKALVLVQSLPSLIAKRRSLDSSRQRDEEELNLITLHQDLTREYLVSASTLTGAMLCIVDNNSESIEENMQPFLQLIQSI